MEQYEGGGRSGGTNSILKSTITLFLSFLFLFLGLQNNKHRNPQLPHYLLPSSTISISEAIP